MLKSPLSKFSNNKKHPQMADVFCCENFKRTFAPEPKQCESLGPCLYKRVDIAGAKRQRYCVVYFMHMKLFLLFVFLIPAVSHACITAQMSGLEHLKNTSILAVPITVIFTCIAGLAFWLHAKRKNRNGKQVALATLIASLVFFLATVIFLFVRL